MTDAERWVFLYFCWYSPVSAPVCKSWPVFLWNTFDMPHRINSQTLVLNLCDVTMCIGAKPVSCNMCHALVPSLFLLLFDLMFSLLFLTPVLSLLFVPLQLKLMVMFLLLLLASYGSKWSQVVTSSEIKKKVADTLCVKYPEYDYGDLE